MRTWIKSAIGLLAWCQISMAAEEAKTDVKLLLSPTDRMHFESGNWVFSLVRKGFPSDITNHGEKENKLFYMDSNRGPGSKEFIAFMGVRQGKYVLLATTDNGVGIVKFAVTEVDVRGNQAISLDMPPIFSVKVVLEGEMDVKEKARFTLSITGTGRTRRYYQNEIPIGVHNGEISGEWDFFLVPRKYKLIVSQYGRVGEQRPYHLEKDLGTVNVSAKDVMGGTLTLHAEGHPWREVLAAPAQ